MRPPARFVLIPGPKFPGLGEALIFFCFFSSIKGRKEDKEESIREDKPERESNKKYSP